MNAKVFLASILAFSVMAGGLFVCMTDSENVNGDDTYEAKVGELFTYYFPDDFDVDIGNEYISGAVNSQPASSFLTWEKPNRYVSGIPSATGTFTITVTFTLPNFVLAGKLTFDVVVAPAIGLEFMTPPAFDMLVGDDALYEPTTNLPSTIEKESGADWLTFSDGKLVGTAPAPGTYTVVLKATSTEGPEQIARQTVTINVYSVLSFMSVPPESAVTFTKFSYYPTVSVPSDISVSGLPTGAVFQDGYIKWVPLTAGDYSFTVHAKSKAGPEQTASQVVSFTVYPVLTFTSIPTAEMVVISNGSVLNFYSMSEYATSVQWDFGDGTSSDDFYPVHSYGEPGEYTVTLTAYNDLGESVTTKSISVIGDSSDPLTIEPYKLLIVFAIVVLAILALFGRFRTKTGRR